MIVVFALLGIGVIAVLAVLLTRPRQLLADDPVPGRPFRPPAAPLTAADLATARFPIALRGYRMADVDAYLAAAVAALQAAEEPEPLPPADGQATVDGQPPQPPASGDGAGVPAAAVGGED